MLHAGVLMKLGGYGCFRVAMYLMPEGAEMWGNFFLVLTTISVVYGAFSAVVQTDLKYINAYSSVSHCGLVLFALLMMTKTACTGAILQMLSHGLMTALFFALIGMIYGMISDGQFTKTTFSEFMNDVEAGKIDEVELHYDRIYYMTKEEAAEAACKAVRDLAIEVGIPQHLTEIGIKEEDSPALAEQAITDVCTPGNPREVTKEDIIALYKKVL